MKKAVKKPLKYSAPALDKGLDIIEYLATQSEACSQAEIGLALKKSQSQIYRMLAALEARRYILKEESTGCYRLSLRLFELSHQQSSIQLLRSAARLPMEILSKEINQASHLSLLYGTSLLVLIERMPSCSVCLAVGEGTLFPITQTTSGVLLLSRMKKSYRESVLARDPFFQSQTISWRKELIKSIEETEKCDYLFLPSKLSIGAHDMAFPIGVPETDTQSILAMSFLESSGKTRIDQEYLSALKVCANQINHNLGLIL